jgi:hypothetical protein
VKIARTSAGPPSLTISDPYRFPLRPAFVPGCWKITEDDADHCQYDSGAEKPLDSECVWHCIAVFFETLEEFIHVSRVW